MQFIKKNGYGILLCLAIAVPSWFLGKAFPIIGGAVIAILAGMVVTLVWKWRDPVDSGIKFVSKKVLQWAVVLLGFGMDLNVVIHTGRQSLPIILCTITVSLVVAFVLSRAMNIPGKIATLVGVGSSICGGSAIAATAPVIDADENEVAQAISVIFFFNVLAALIFPTLGQLIGFDTASGEAFGIFAGTAVNDTSSVTATAATWDSMWHLGTQTLDKAVTVKLTQNDDDNNFYTESRVALIGGEDYVLQVSGMEGKDMSDLKLVLDFGGGVGGSTVTVSDIILRESK